MDTTSTPACVGFIMDGNRRWAKGKGLPTVAGHIRGSEVFSDMIRGIRDRGIPHAVFYAFSSENWNRPADEVQALMELMGNKMKEVINTLTSENTDEKKVQFKFIGSTEAFSEDLQNRMKEIEALSSGGTTTIWIALSYGGREEIVRATNKALAQGVPVTEESFGTLLYTHGMPDPDLIVRTGGQERLSNFLPWQSVYSELLFLDKFWPDMTVDDLDSAVAEFIHRTRNFGV